MNVEQFALHLLGTSIDDMVEFWLDLGSVWPESDPWDVFAQFMHGVLKS